LPHPVLLATTAATTVFADTDIAQLEAAQLDAAQLARRVGQLHLDCSGSAT
jgi:hypothetical protein